MVATALPFWMHPPRRSLRSFPADWALRLGASVTPAERRAVPGALFRAARCPGLVLETCDAAAVGVYEEAWAALVDRALEPDVFITPGFATAAIRHFPLAQRPVFLLVWDERQGERATLVGLCALQPRRPLLGPVTSSCWTHEQATLAAPLLDRERGAAALALMLEHLDRNTSHWGGLLVRGIDRDGALFRLLAAAGPAALVETRARAVLRRSDAGGSPRRAGAHAKELRRQRRRLAEEGAFGYRSARTPEEVRLATERFLHLEARGWKGGRGTALLKNAGLAAFTRAMTRQLARRGACRIDALELDGEPVAMGVVLTCGDRAFFWKTAYDERLKRRSPGKQLADILREVQRADPSVALTDSCAIPDHSMIDGVWEDRMTVADMLVAGPAVPAGRVAAAAAALRRGRRLVSTVKRLLHPLRRLGQGR